jgi:hypothetical protein
VIADHTCGCVIVDGMAKTCGRDHNVIIPFPRIDYNFFPSMDDFET